MESGGKMRALLLRKGKKEADRREGMEEEGKRKGFAGPMSKCFLRPCVCIFICQQEETTHQSIAQYVGWARQKGPGTLTRK